jgi:hypothetical protein
MKRMTKRRKWLFGVTALVALNLALAFVPGSFALPRDLAHYFFGQKMVRAEVIVKDSSGLHDFQLDRGRIVRVNGTSVTLRERDGLVKAIAVAANANITLNGRPVSIFALRRGLQALTIRNGDAAAQTVRATSKR